MADMKKETEAKIEQLQLLEQNLQNFLVQRQQFQQQIVEIESALGELESTTQAYKIVGNIMVASDKDKLKKDLEKKKEVLDLRIKTLEKQEKQLKDKASQTQSEVLKEMEKK
jgi:prefoldin beta subunit